jgi:hypothetical protein
MRIGVVLQVWAVHLTACSAAIGHGPAIGGERPGERREVSGWLIAADTIIPDSNDPLGARFGRRHGLGAPLCSFRELPFGSESVWTVRHCRTLEAHRPMLKPLPVDA